VRVAQPTFVVGSGDQADLRLADGAVSREHLRITLHPSGIRLRDDGSKNGTWIGGLRVHDVELTSDVVVEMGKSLVAIALETSAVELPLSPNARFGSAIGVSVAMRHLFSLLERAAQSDVTVLLEGESGVGKEVLARAIHDTSPRARGPFVAVDCGAMPSNLIESELFGYERGAFTGAATARSGLFTEANGGTIFLDEVGELPLELQPKLLRVLELREVRPLGAPASRRVDVRVVAATNRNLSEAAHANEFRQDLFYRLAVARVTVPPLRERREDVEPIARAFLRRVSGDEQADLPQDFLALLSAYSWPGNVRELRNVVERYALLGIRDAGTLFDGPAPGGDDPNDLSHLPLQEARRIAMERFEREYAPRVLERAGGVVSRAAQLAQIARPSFYRMLDRLRMTRDDES
jgi:transcriptional regulator with PAS, ATPase and Fis domain